MPDPKLPEYVDDRINLLYKECAAERGSMHDAEWRGPRESPSILGEAEVFADTVVGFATSRKKRKIRDAATLRSGLAGCSLAANTVLASWIRQNAATYPRFVRYLQAIEELRVTALRMLPKM